MPRLRCRFRLHRGDVQEVQAAGFVDQTMSGQATADGLASRRYVPGVKAGALGAATVLASALVIAAAVAITCIPG